MHGETLELPLFPLDQVLFPGMALPLHVVEERYRLMVNTCLEGNRQFGIVLDRNSLIDGDLIAMHPVGTSALITRADVREDGDLDIQMAGLERFRTLRLVRSEPYAVGHIEPFPLEQVNASAVFRQVRTIGDLLVQYLRLVDEVLGTLVQIHETPRDPSSLAYLVGIILQVPMEEKQELLSILNLPMLLSRECLILRRERDLLQRMRAVQLGNVGYVQGATSCLSLN